MYLEYDGYWKNRFDICIYIFNYIFQPISSIYCSLSIAITTNFEYHNSIDIIIHINDIKKCLQF